MHELISADQRAIATDPLLLILVAFWLIWFLVRQRRELGVATDFKARYNAGAKIVAAFFVLAGTLLGYNGLTLQMNTEAYQNEHSAAANDAIPGNQYLTELVSDPDSFQSDKLVKMLALQRQVQSTDDLDPVSLAKIDQLDESDDDKAGTLVMLYCVTLANHGYKFHRPQLTDLFSHCPWYAPANPNLAAVRSKFNSYETSNSKLLASRIQKYIGDAPANWQQNL